jgi:hypothetical protein
LHLARLLEVVQQEEGLTPLREESEWAGFAALLDRGLFTGQRCSFLGRPLSGGCVGEEDVAATEGALIEEAQAALMAEDGASASER